MKSSRFASYLRCLSNKDETAPAPPYNLAAKTTGTSVALAWKPSPDKDVAGYFVLRLGRNLGSATGTTFADEKLDPATGYTYSVRAYDGAGNISAPATLVATTKNAFPDLTVSSVRIAAGEDKMGSEAHFEAVVQKHGKRADSGEDDDWRRVLCGRSSRQLVGHISGATRGWRIGHAQIEQRANRKRNVDSGGGRAHDSRGCGRCEPRERIERRKQHGGFGGWEVELPHSHNFQLQYENCTPLHPQRRPNSTCPRRASANAPDARFGRVRHSLA